MIVFHLRRYLSKITEYIHVEKEVVAPGPPMLESTANHCMTKIDQRTAFLTGGILDNGMNSDKVYFFNHKIQQWNRGLPMPVPLKNLDCGFHLQSINSSIPFWLCLLIQIALSVNGIVVAGGIAPSMKFPNQHLDSSMILDLEQNRWIQGPQISIEEDIFEVDLLSSYDRDNLFLLALTYQSLDLFQFQCNSSILAEEEGCAWIPLTTLPRRVNFIAFSAPVSLVSSTSAKCEYSKSKTFISICCDLICMFWIMYRIGWLS